jgi:hypothetical protein
MKLCSRSFFITLIALSGFHQVGRASMDHLEVRMEVRSPGLKMDQLFMKYPHFFINFMDIQEDQIPYVTIMNSNEDVCGGQPYYDSINTDGSYGGRIALTANVQSRNGKNLAWIDPLAQVCDQAEVNGEGVTLHGKTKISKNAKVTENAFIENSEVTDRSHVFGHAHVKQSLETPLDCLLRWK